MLTEPSSPLPYLAQASVCRGGIHFFHGSGASCLLPWAMSPEILSLIDAMGKAIAASRRVQVEEKRGEDSRIDTPAVSASSAAARRGANGHSS